MPFIYPAEFWDSLPQICLTANALCELDRRNKQTESDQPSQRLEAYRISLPRDDFLQCYAEERLKDISSFARQGGPDLLDLRGYPEPVPPSRFAMSQSARPPLKHKFSSEYTSPSPPRRSKTTTSSGVYDPNFELQMIVHNIYPIWYEYLNGSQPLKPKNWDSLNRMLVRRRPSLSLSVFPKKRFEEFAAADIRVTKENQITKKVVPLIQGTIKDRRCVEGEIIFTNLVDLITENPEAKLLPKAKPDLYYGARPEQLRDDIRNQLSRHIIPSTSEHLPIVPNFFLEAKGPDGTMAVALRQVLQDGAIGARGIHSLQTYGQANPTFDNKAYTITSIYHAGTLKMYAHYIAQPNGPGTRPEYYMHQLGTYAMTHNLDSLAQGLTAFRNARDWTEAQRNAAIERANAT